MDLLTLAQTIWRHKIATVPVIIVMLIGVVYVLKVKSPVYKTSADYILVNPPGPPTVQQIHQDPALGLINTNNPYENWGNLSYVSSLLTATVTSNPVLGQLEKEGVDPGFSVGPDMSYPLGTPIVAVTSTASSAAVATRSAELVGQDLSKQLSRLQADQGTDPRYFIKVQQLSPPAPATEQMSGKLRTLIAVIAVGIILLFVAVSTMTALEERRARRARPVPPPRPAEHELRVPARRGSYWHPDEDLPAADHAPSVNPAPIAQNGNGHSVDADDRETAGVAQRRFATRRRTL